MKPLRPADILLTDKLSEGLVITFTDGKTALYPTKFLYESISKVQELFDAPEDSDLPEESPRYHPEPTRALIRDDSGWIPRETQ